MGNIYHQWNGTVLTITSDSGTSSADLKGADGCRGAQGPAGIIINPDGSIDCNGFATKEELQEAIENVESSDVDKTLTKEGSAADAKTTGDRLAIVEAHIPVCLTQEEYDALDASGKLNADTPYIIIEDDGK